MYILGAGMHPWGKWGRDFTEYGVVAARAALAEAGLDWRQIQLVAGADTIRNGYPGFVAGATFAQKLGWNGVPVSSSYAACASGSQALQSARAQILAGFCDVALVIGADTTPKGFFAPVGGERKNDPDWQRFHLIGATNPVYFALLARRRMDLYGATLEDFAAGEGQERPARPGQPERPLPQGDLGRRRAGQPGGLGSAAAARHLRHLRRRGRADRGEQVVRREAPRLAGGCAVGARRQHRDPAIPPASARIAGHCNGFHRCGARPGAGVQRPDPRRRLRRGRHRARGPEPGRGLRPVHRAGARLVRAPGLCAKGEAEQLLRSGATTIGGRIPVNASGGLACFGEAIPAQAIAQVCELTWQLKGQATGRQVEGAKVGITANQGLFGHGSSVIVAR